MSSSSLSALHIGRDRELLCRNVTRHGSNTKFAISPVLPYSTEIEGRELLLCEDLAHQKQEITDLIKVEGGNVTSKEDHGKGIELDMNQDFKFNQDVQEGSHQYSTEKDEITSSKVDNNAAPHMFDKFEDFPGHLKRCLLYCHLFPLGYEFERETLVQLWIAADLINGEATNRIEDEAGKCFENLVLRRYIMPSRGHNAYKVNEAKFPVWFLVKESSSGEFVRINAGGSSDISDKTLHLSLSHDENFNPQIFNELRKCQSLQTLLLLGHFGYSVKEVPEDLFLTLKSLRTLVLSHTKISKLPHSVVYLKSLQYLDLSDTIIKGLPRALCCLKSLQTLKLRDCFYLLALPEGMKELTNLRHLDLDIVLHLMYMPKEMGKLKNLQTLPGFIVGSDDGRGIQELSDLNNIAGSLCISRLENVSSVDEAKKANLKDKKYLTRLELRWDRDSEIEEQIFECLEPHSGLQELEIQFYGGSVFPSWISNPLFSITSLALYQCVNCHSLPSIGYLPKLKSLTIVAMYKVRHINRFFSDHEEVSRNEQDCAFPELEELILNDFSDLEIWAGVKTGDFPKLLDVRIKHCPKLPELPSMSHLHSLKYMELAACSELQSLPGECLPASLESLIIQGCPNLHEHCCQGGKEWKKMAHVPSVWIDDGESTSDDSY